MIVTQRNRFWPSRDVLHSGLLGYLGSRALWPTYRNWSTIARRSDLLPAWQYDDSITISTRILSSYYHRASSWRVLDDLKQFKTIANLCCVHYMPVILDVGPNDSSRNLLVPRRSFGLFWRYPCDLQTIFPFSDLSSILQSSESFQYRSDVLNSGILNF